MTKIRISSLLLSLMLILSACGSNVAATEPDNASPQNTSAVEEVYRRYDRSYSSDTFSVRKIDALAGRQNSFIRGVDISLSSAIYDSGGTYRNFLGKEEPLCKILADAGVNTVRIRLFHDFTSPCGTLCGRLDLARVISMRREAGRSGLKVILDLHFSDSWADPAHQALPFAWKDYSYDEVKSAVYDYTRKTLDEIKSNGLTIDYIQTGNEISNGMLFPHGQIDWNNREDSFDRLTELLSQSSRAVREVFPNCRIILHTANGLYRWGSANEWGSAELFYYQELEKRGLDYDIAGASFYTFEDDTPISCISEIIDMYKDEIDKPVMIVETSYAYTYKWNDLTDNVFYTDRELPAYPVSFQGQSNFLLDMMEEVAAAKDGNGLGVCWWGGEWIPNSDRDMRTPWANQALFTYEGIATPTLSVFNQCMPTD